MAGPSSHGADDPAASSRRLHARFIRYRMLLRKYWWVVAFGVALGTGIAAWMVASQKQIYMSQARMMVSGKINLPEGGSFSEEMTHFMNTQGELMKDEAIRTRAEAYVRTTAAEIPVSMVMLRVEPLPQTSIFALTATGEEPLYTQKFLDAILHEYIATRREMRSQKGEFAAGAIDEEIERVAAELRKEEDRLLAFQRDNKTGFLEQEGNAAAAYLSKLNTRLAELRNESQLLDLFDADQQIARDRKMPKPDGGDLREGDPRTPSATGPLLEYERARQRIETLKAERAGYARDLTPRHPIMVELDEQIAQQQQLIDTFRKQSTEELKRRRDATTLEIRNLETTVKEWEAKAASNSERLTQHAGIQAGISRMRAQYENLSRSKGSVEITRNVDQEIISVRQKATPAQTARFGVARTLTSGFVLGLLGGIVCLLGISMFDDRIDSVVDFQATFPDRLLATIPHVSCAVGTVDVAPLLPDDERHTFVESMRSLRSSIFFLPVEGPPPRTFLVTSAVPNEGKSTVALNFAITMAMFDVRVLLVDGDLRRGELHHALDLPNGAGFGDVLNGDCALQSAVQQTRVPGLSLLSRGSTVQNPGELFLSTDTDRFLRAAAAQYDYVIMDSAPVTAADDTSSLAPKVHATLFVFRFAASSMRISQKALDTLRERQVNVLGLVCNDVDESLQDYYYYRYSEYYGSQKKDAGKKQAARA
ncbi:MAG: polysaccharide biosynthesis tyrosine autokinase [Verrucomicrobia bacterium]|nr:polysaccharide biosynthesis tyrosine autokinase [Verrucomicrobiota bacterium]